MQRVAHVYHDITEISQNDYPRKISKTRQDWRSHVSNRGLGKRTNKHLEVLVQDVTFSWRLCWPIPLGYAIYSIYYLRICMQCRAAIAPRSGARESGWCLAKTNFHSKNMFGGIAAKIFAQFRYYLFGTMQVPMLSISWPLVSVYRWRRRYQGLRTTISLAVHVLEGMHVHKNHKLTHVECCRHRKMDHTNDPKRLLKTSFLLNLGSDFCFLRIWVT